MREVHWSHRCALHAENKSKANPCSSSQDLSFFLFFFISNQDIIKSVKYNSCAQEVYKRNTWLEGEKRAGKDPPLYLDLKQPKEKKEEN